jgi:hypothetical protein
LDHIRETFRVHAANIDLIAAPRKHGAGMIPGAEFRRFGGEARNEQTARI